MLRITRGATLRMKDLTATGASLLSEGGCLGGFGERLLPELCGGFLGGLGRRGARYLLRRVHSGGHCTV